MNNLPQSQEAYGPKEVSEALNHVTEMDIDSIIAAVVDTAMENQGYALSPDTIDHLRSTIATGFTALVLANMLLKGALHVEFDEQADDLVWSHVE